MRRRGAQRQDSRAGGEQGAYHRQLSFNAANAPL